MFSRGIKTLNSSHIPKPTIKLDSGSFSSPPGGCHTGITPIPIARLIQESDSTRQRRLPAWSRYPLYGGLLRIQSPWFNAQDVQAVLQRRQYCLDVKYKTRGMTGENRAENRFTEVPRAIELNRWLVVLVVCDP